METKFFSESTKQSFSSVQFEKSSIYTLPDRSQLHLYHDSAGALWAKHIQDDGSYHTLPLMKTGGQANVQDLKAIHPTRLSIMSSSTGETVVYWGMPGLPAGGACSSSQGTKAQPSNALDALQELERNKRILQIKTYLITLPHYLYPFQREALTYQVSVALKKINDEIAEVLQSDEEDEEDEGKRDGHDDEVKHQGSFSVASQHVAEDFSLPRVMMTREELSFSQLLQELSEHIYDKMTLKHNKNIDVCAQHERFADYFSWKKNQLILFLDHQMKQCLSSCWVELIANKVHKSSEVLTLEDFRDAFFSENGFFKNVEDIFHMKLLVQHVLVEILAQEDMHGKYLRLYQEMSDTLLQGVSNVNSDIYVKFKAMPLSSDSTLLADLQLDCLRKIPLAEYSAALLAKRYQLLERPDLAQNATQEGRLLRKLMYGMLNRYRDQEDNLPEEALPALLFLSQINEPELFKRLLEQLLVDIKNDPFIHQHKIMLLSAVILQVPTKGMKHDGTFDLAQAKRYCSPSQLKTCMNIINKKVFSSLVDPEDTDLQVSLDGLIVILNSMVLMGAYGLTNAGREALQTTLEPLKTSWDHLLWNKLRGNRAEDPSLDSKRRYLQMALDAIEGTAQEDYDANKEQLKTLITGSIALTAAVLTCNVPALFQHVSTIGSAGEKLTEAFVEAIKDAATYVDDNSDAIEAVAEMVTLTHNAIEEKRSEGIYNKVTKLFHCFQKPYPSWLHYFSPAAHLQGVYGKRGSSQSRVFTFFIIDQLEKIARHSHRNINDRRVAVELLACVLCNCAYENFQISHGTRLKRFSAADDIRHYAAKCLVAMSQMIHVDQFTTLLAETAGNILRDLPDKYKKKYVQLNATGSDRPSTLLQGNNDLFQAALEHLSEQHVLTKLHQESRRGYVRDIVPLHRIKIYGALQKQRGDETDLQLAFKQFMQADVDVMLIQGSVGAGKSMIMRLFENQQWNDYLWGRNPYIPIFVHLSKVRNPERCIEEVLLHQGCGQETVTKLREDKQNCFVFFLDGYDELKVPKNLYEANKLTKDWSNNRPAKLVITSRTEYLQNYRQNYHSLFQSERGSEYLLEYHVSDITPKQIADYLEQKVLHNQRELWQNPQDNQLQTRLANFVEVAAYQEQIQQLQLADIMNTPLMLTMIIDVLPELEDKKNALNGLIATHTSSQGAYDEGSLSLTLQSARRDDPSRSNLPQLEEKAEKLTTTRPKVTKAMIYNECMRRRFAKEATRLLEEKVFPIPLGYNLESSFHEYCKGLAAILYLRDKGSVSVESRSYVFDMARQDVALDVDHTLQSLFDASIKVTIAREGARTILIEGDGELCFSHKSFMEYFAAYAFFKELEDLTLHNGILRAPVKGSLLARKSLFDKQHVEIEVMNFLVDMLEDQRDSIVKQPPRQASPINIQPKLKAWLIEHEQQVIDIVDGFTKGEGAEYLDASLESKGEQPKENANVMFDRTMLILCWQSPHILYSHFEKNDKRIGIFLQTAPKMFSKEIVSTAVALAKLEQDEQQQEKYIYLSLILYLQGQSEDYLRDLIKTISQQPAKAEQEGSSKRLEQQFLEELLKENYPEQESAMKLFRNKEPGMAAALILNALKQSGQLAAMQLFFTLSSELEKVSIQDYLLHPEEKHESCNQDADARISVLTKLAELNQDVFEYIASSLNNRPKNIMMAERALESICTVTSSFERVQTLINNLVSILKKAVSDNRKESSQDPERQRAINILVRLGKRKLDHVLGKTYLTTHLEQLQRHVAMAEEKEVQALLTLCPSLALDQRPFDDISDLRCQGTNNNDFRRQFESTSIFQFAVWSLDFKMVEMVLNSLSDRLTSELYETVLKQFHETIEYTDAEISVDGIVKSTPRQQQFFDLHTFANVLKEYQEYTGSDPMVYWAKCIGQEQRRLPMFFINLYCGWENFPISYDSFDALFDNFSRVHVVHNVNNEEDQGKQWFDLLEDPGYVGYINAYRRDKKASPTGSAGTSFASNLAEYLFKSCKEKIAQLMRDFTQRHAPNNLQDVMSEDKRDGSNVSSLSSSSSSSSRPTSPSPAFFNSPVPSNQNSALKTPTNHSQKRQRLLSRTTQFTTWPRQDIPKATQGQAESIMPDQRMWDETRIPTISSSSSSSGSVAKFGSKN